MLLAPAVGFRRCVAKASELAEVWKHSFLMNADWKAAMKRGEIRSMSGRPSRKSPSEKA